MLPYIYPLHSIAANHYPLPLLFTPNKLQKTKDDREMIEGWSKDHRRIIGRTLGEHRVNIGSTSDQHRVCIGTAWELPAVYKGLRVLLPASRGAGQTNL